MTEVREGRPAVEVAERYGVTRQTVTAWRERYDCAGLDASPADPNSHRRRPGCTDLRDAPPSSTRRIAVELHRDIGTRAPSQATIHRVLVRNGLVNTQQQQHKRAYKRWERDAPMHLRQLDLVGGIVLADGRECKILTAIDDQSRFVAAVLEKPSGAAFFDAMARWGVYLSKC